MGNPQNTDFSPPPQQDPLLLSFSKKSEPRNPLQTKTSNYNSKSKNQNLYPQPTHISNKQTYKLTLKEEKTEEELQEDKVSDVQEYKASRLFCFTNDGINVYLELTFFYKLNAAKILDMYLQFGDNWKEGLARISVESIKESSIQFLSKDYFTKRNEINDKLKENLQKSFDEKAEWAATVGSIFSTFLFLFFYLL